MECVSPLNVGVELSNQNIFFKRVICNTSRRLVCSRRSSEENTDPLKMPILNYQAEKEKRILHAVRSGQRYDGDKLGGIMR